MPQFRKVSLRLFLHVNEWLLFLFYLQLVARDLHAIIVVWSEICFLAVKARLCDVLALSLLSQSWYTPIQILYHSSTLLGILIIELVRLAAKFDAWVPTLGYKLSIPLCIRTEIQDLFTPQRLGQVR